MKKDYKACSIDAQIKDVDTQKGVVTGYFSSFNNKDFDGDIIRPGAFTKTIAERGPQGNGDIAHLLQHDTNKPIGKLLALREDTKGLYYESQISKSEQSVLIKIEEGIYKQHSIGFVIPSGKAGFSKEENANIIHEVKLYEGSTVLWGANRETPVTGVKELSEIKTKLESILKNASTLTDEQFLQIEAEYKAISQLFDQLKAAIQPPLRTEPEGDYSQVIDHIKQSFSFLR